MFNIVLPNPIHSRSFVSKRLANHSACLLYLDKRKDVSVSYDDGESEAWPIRLRPGISDGNGKYSCYFTVNKNLFIILDADRPHENLQEWLTYYGSKIKGIFLACYYKDLQKIFKSFNVNVFPYFLSSNFGGRFLDNDNETQNLPNYSINKDIPIFFRGKFKNNAQRFDLSQRVKKHFPDSYIENASFNYISPDNYLNLIQRAKIVWSPPSVVGVKNRYALYGREREAMCVESLFVRQPIDVFTPEEIVPGEHFVEVERDNSNLIEILEKYLSDEKERKRIARNGRLFFEKNCTSLARATYLLEKCISVI